MAAIAEMGISKDVKLDMAARRRKKHKNKISGLALQRDRANTNKKVGYQEKLPVLIADFLLPNAQASFVEAQISDLKTLSLEQRHRVSVSIQEAEELVLYEANEHLANKLPW